MKRTMLELTATQQDIYLEGKLFGKVINNIGGYQKYRCRLDVTRFQHAREQLLQTTDAYRLRFHEASGCCVPFVSDDAPPILQMVDCRTESLALAWIQEQFEMPFGDLSTSVFQDALIQLSPDEYWYFAKAHHLIMDGWGFTLQMQRLLWLYEHLAKPEATTGLEGTPHPSFVDYMRLQLGYRDSARYLQSRQYWLAHHDRAPGTLFAPTAGRETASGSRRISAILDTRLIDALRRLASDVKANLVTVIYAALYVYFSRAYQRNDITICSPVHNRHGVADKDIIGSIVNTNSHRLVAPTDISFLKLVEHVASVQRKNYRHSQFPFGDLVRALREKSDAAAESLGEIAFNYQKLDFQLAIHERAVETHYLSHSNERIPLTFVLCEYGKDQDVWLHLDYRASYFEESQASALLDRMLGLLRQICDESSRPISEYSLLTPAEWQDQFVAWQGARIPLKEGACIHEFFEEQVLRTPDRIAVICDGASLTYAELNQRANRLACRLIDQGAESGCLIGICHSRSLNLPVAMLAVLKAGSAYVPIDPAYPRARVQYIFNDAHLAIVVADAQGLAALGTPNCTVINPETLFAEDAPAGTTWPNPNRSVTGLSATDLAYVIYTSGSTGRPKGVLIEHRNTTAFIQWALRQFTSNELASVLAATSICFDLSIFELFVPLAAGGCVVLVDNVLALKDRGMDDLSLINTVPSAIQGLLETNAIPPSLRCINLAGELLRQGLVDALYELGTVKVYDLYGPSESCTYSTVCLRTMGGDTNIGRPIANTQVYVLDEAGNPLPPGMTGELHIGGAGLARGYLNQQALTDEKFVFNRHMDAPLYRTGDMVRFTTDGRLQYVGRKDNQIKVRGYRIEPGEIEARLLEHPVIADCAVVGHEHPGQSGGKVIVAYVVAANPASDQAAVPDSPSAAALAEFVAERLPAYMVPSQFITLPSLPLMPNGKVDRRALPAPGDSGRHETTYVAPGTEVEKKLYALWRTTLNHEHIGIRDSFFALGGDSLLLMKLASAVEHELGLHVDLPLLFANPTIETQGRLLAEQLEFAQLRQAVSVFDDAPASSYVDL